MAGQIAKAPKALEYAGVEWDFLDLEQMRKLPADSEERQRRIIGRCNYYMYSYISLRGAEYDNPAKCFIAKYKTNQGSNAGRQTQVVEPNLIRNLVSNALESWNSQGNQKARELNAAVDQIPHPERIKKVVCIGLGKMVFESLPIEAADTLNQIATGPILQHVAAIAIVQRLQARTGQKVELFTADPDYGSAHTEALQTLSGIQFTVLDAGYGKHQHFAMIDDATFVINIAGAQCPLEILLTEYARPVAMIVSYWPKALERDILWYELEDEDTREKVAIPGTPWVPTSPRRVKYMFEREYTRVEGLSHRFVGNCLSDEMRGELERSGEFEVMPGFAMWPETTHMFIRKH
ncbi:hypothetical protein F4779DRAFT_633944 [Xylariaceae sp. FL0662B]|nr:hypothetical protein F4779DRAFT_633944 [Xylariaceae sp. FL0662B]